MVVGRTTATAKTAVLAAPHRRARVAGGVACGEFATRVMRAHIPPLFGSPGVAERETHEILTSNDTCIQGRFAALTHQLTGFVITPLESVDVDDGSRVGLRSLVPKSKGQSCRLPNRS
jgi:hypothetical protein